MNVVDYSHSFVSIIPTVVALSLAIISHRVILSLGVGIVLGALLLNDFLIYKTIPYLYASLKALFVMDKMSIVLFLLLLGMMTALLTLSGGASAFAYRAQRKVKSKRGSKLLAAFLGVFIFIDDYFNSLAVGTIVRPVTDRFHVSRPKLAYILDSTAAPMCVLMPISSWGAYIITLIGGILVTYDVTGYTPLSAFIALIPMNFYAIFALAMVFVMSWFQLDIGPMKRHEIEASRGCGFDEGSDVVNQAEELTEEINIKESGQGRVGDLIWPIVVLLFSTFFFMLLTGYQVLMVDSRVFTILGVFENINVGKSLCLGGIFGVIAAFIPIIRQKLPIFEVFSVLWLGIKSMSGAILILLFAWTIGNVIGDMKTGLYLSSLIEGNISPMLLPVILFLLAGFMSFSTGTSWGTFGIMLYIAGDLAAATDISLILPMLSAVLAGSVFGDHCSPISDTTVLSSAGAHCSHMDHVKTQIPYALSIALVSMTGYLVLGFTQSLIVAFIAAFIIFIMACVFMAWLSRRPLTLSSKV